MDNLSWGIAHLLNAQKAEDAPISRDYPVPLYSPRALRPGVAGCPPWAGIGVQHAPEYATLGAITFLHSMFVIIASGNLDAINNLISGLKKNKNISQLPSSFPHQFLANLETAPLQIVSARYGSPASFDLLGVGSVLEMLRDTVKDMVWRGKHEMQMAELERKHKQAEMRNDRLAMEKKSIEIATEKVKLEKMKLENEKFLIETASQKLDLLEKVSGLHLHDEDKHLLISAIIPKMNIIANDPTSPRLESKIKSLLSLGEDG